MGSGASGQGEQAVVLLHGLWMGRGVMRFLRKRLREDQAGRQVLDFEYPSMDATLEENSLALSECVAGIDAPTVHLVGHSLGGVIILDMLQRSLPRQGGRVVCLGSPLCGSASARNVRRLPLGRAMLGRTIQQVMNSGVHHWNGPREVGVIAGSVGMGLGMFAGHLKPPHDGTVSVAETRLPGASDHLVVHVNHMGLLLSQEVAEQTACFLRHGHFKHP